MSMRLWQKSSTVVIEGRHRLKPRSHSLRSVVVPICSVPASNLVADTRNVHTSTPAFSYDQSLGTKATPISGLSMVPSTMFRQQNIGSSWQRSIVVRWKNKQAKIGLHLQNLNEMAHEKERQAAEERRKKKKQKDEARKNKKKDGISHEQASSSSSANVASVSALEAREEEPADANHPDSDDEEHDGSVLPNPISLKTKMIKHAQRFDEYLKTVRGPEPSPELFDGITVNAYGDPTTPLQAVAQVELISHSLATATCYDPALAKTVANVIRDKLSFDPSVDEDGVVQISIPRMSLETRTETANMVKKRAEFYRQRIRGVRRKALDVVKQGVAGKLEHISKDDAFRVQKEIEQMTEDTIEKINKAAEKKHESIMKV